MWICGGTLGSNGSGGAEGGSINGATQGCYWIRVLFDVIEECYCRASITLVIIIHLLLRRLVFALGPATGAAPSSHNGDGRPMALIISLAARKGLFAFHLWPL